MKARKLVYSNRRELTGYGGTKLRAAGKRQTDQRICIAAAIYERNRPDPGIKNRQAPCGACRFLVRAAGLEPARRMAMEPKSIESTNSTTPAYSDQYSTPAAVTQAKIPAAAEKSPPAAKKVSYFPETVIQYKAKNTSILRDA